MNTERLSRVIVDASAGVLGGLGAALLGGTIAELMQMSDETLFKYPFPTDRNEAIITAAGIAVGAFTGDRLLGRRM